MNSLIELYKYMAEHKKLVEKITSMDENEFLSDEIALNVGLGFVNGLEDKLVSIDKRILIRDKIIYNHYNEFLSLHSYFLNDYGEINGYLVYDYLKGDYLVLLDRIKNIIKD